MTSTGALIEERLSSGSIVSGRLLASELGVSRTAVFKHIARLRRDGYSIGSLHGQGYRLEPRFDGLLPLEIRNRLTTRTFGRAIEMLESAESTQILLRRRAEEGAPEGLVVVALEQRAGRGRGGRAWHSPRGGLWFSLLLRPKIPMRELYMLTLIFGIAVTRALKQWGLEPRLKWPNDILVGEMKVCGILLETSGEPDRAEFVVVGIGVNANFPAACLPEEARPTSATILDLLGEKIDRAALLGAILSESEALYGQASSGGFGPIVREWKATSCTIGSEVVISSLGREIRGLAVDIGTDGALVVQTSNGLERVYSGNLSYSKRKGA